MGTVIATPVGTFVKEKMTKKEKEKLREFKPELYQKLFPKWK